LLPYESCNLGSINLSKFVKNKKIDYERLRQVVHTAVHFLDNVIDMNEYPLKQIEKMTKGNRKIGLGVMGFADMLYQLGIPYNSEDGITTGEQVMRFVKQEADKASEELAKKRGCFPNWDKSIYYKKRKMRNATRTTIAPTGSISMIADCSSGIEPLFALSFIKKVMDGKEFLYVNEIFKHSCMERGIYSEALMEKIANKGTIQDIQEIPEEVRRIFVVSHDINPEWHVRMQAAFQKHTDNAVSKTVNFPNYATIKDVETVYMLAYELGCKGVTIYRDGSRSEQVLNITMPPKKEETDKETCPNCKTKMNMQEGCATCPNCGYGVCSG
jgi:ribonucleoside-diphosphate reductase alpha chain